MIVKLRKGTECSLSGNNSNFLHRTCTLSKLTIEECIHLFNTTQAHDEQHGRPFYQDSCRWIAQSSQSWSWYVSLLPYCCGSLTCLLFQRPFAPQGLPSACKELSDHLGLAITKGLSPAGLLKDSSSQSGLLLWVSSELSHTMSPTRFFIVTVNVSWTTILLDS